METKKEWKKQYEDQAGEQDEVVGEFFFVPNFCIFPIWFSGNIKEMENIHTHRKDTAMLNNESKCLCGCVEIS